MLSNTSSNKKVNDTSSPSMQEILKVVNSQEQLVVDVESVKDVGSIRDNTMHACEQETYIIDAGPKIFPIQMDPRRKLLARLGQSGLLNGEQERKRRSRDLKDYPDIAALAHVAKTKENFYELMGSPQLTFASEPKVTLDNSTSMGYGGAISPTSTTCVDSTTDKFEDTSSCDDLSMTHEVSKPDILSSLTSRRTSFTRTPSPGEPSMPHQPKEPHRDTDRADLLWKLAAQGSPELKPLDHIEMETDGSTKAGVYLLSSPMAGPTGDPQDAFQSIFKPLDEEDFQRRGIEIGMGALREEAAFVIDHETGGQAHVPTTARASIEEHGVRKKGSVQQFVEGSMGSVEDFGMPRDLAAAEKFVGLDNVQAVACFDIRTFNTDRHSGNLLLAGGLPHKIVCIDHGCVLPAWWALESSRFDAWLDWPHVKAPTSETTRSLIAQVSDKLPDVVQELESLGLPEQAIWTFEICTALLHTGVLTHGLTLHSVALLMTRLDPGQPCWLESTVAEACRTAGASAEFKPQGKYGDLMLDVDQKILNLFLAPAGCPFEQKHLSTFRQAFFSALHDAFENPEVVKAAQDAENTWA